MYTALYMYIAQLIFTKKNDKILKSMNFRGDFVNIAQEKNIKSTDAQLRAKKKYANSKWRPNVYIDMNKREEIEKHFASKGYKSFNEYVINLINEDMKEN